LTVFAAVLELLVAEGYVRFEHYFVDGTKIEANANRYTFVWGKSVARYKARLQTQVKELFVKIDEEEQREEQEYGGRDLPELGEASTLTSEKVEAFVDQLEASLQSSPPTTKPKQKEHKRLVRKVRRTILPRLRKYEQQQAILGERNSFSKTDPDATFMRLKEDHMRNGQLKPAYNVQLGTENQFIVGYSVHQRPTDTRCLIPHLEHVKEQFGRLPATVVADAGYGSEENYVYLEREGLIPLVKYSTFHKEGSKNWQQDISRIENWTYDETNDEWVCPNGQRLVFQYESKGKTAGSYRPQLRHYHSLSCEGCPLRIQCTKAKGNRVICVSLPFLRAKQKVRALLLSEEGKQLATRRMTEVESVFGQLKQNRGFRRFHLRGLSKVTLKVGWLALAHNLLKKAALVTQGTWV